MVTVKVRKFGNSLGVILPKEVIQRLRTKDGARLFLIESLGGEYRLTPADAEFELQMEAAKDGMARYRNVLRTLAK